MPAKRQSSVPPVSAAAATRADVEALLAQAAALSAQLDAKAAFTPSAYATTSSSGGGGNGSGGNSSKKDDDGWSTITDDRKVAYEKRKAKKIAEAKAELLSKTDLHDEDAVAAALLKADAVAAKFGGGSNSTPFKIDKNSGKGPAQTKKKKPASNKLQIQNETQLIEVVTGLVRNVPNNRPIQVSAIGDKLTEMTGQAWNKKLKSQYGTLPEFLKKRPNVFHVTADSKVFIRSDWDALKRDDSSAAAAKKKKAAAAAATNGSAAGAAGEHKSKAKHASGGSGGAEAVEDSSSAAGRLIAVILLFIAVAVGVYMSVEKISFGELITRVSGGRK